MKIGWLLGWAVPEAWFAPLVRSVLPAAAHTFVTVAPDALVRLETAGPYDWAVGYSLGSWLLLGAVGRAEKLGRVALLAPFLAFPRESGAGGRVARAQVSLLARRLRLGRPAALADFYVRAGLDVSLADAAGLGTQDLLWGLEQLAHGASAPAPPAGWRAWCGADDALLDAVRIRELAPAVRIVPEATHHPAALLREFAKETA